MVTAPATLTDPLASRPMSAFALVLTKLGTVVMAVWSSSARQLAYNADLQRLGRTICAFLNFGEATRELPRASFLHIGQLHIAAISNELCSVCLCGAQAAHRNLCAELRLRQALHNFMGVCGPHLRQEVTREEKHVAGYGVRDVCGLAQPFAFEEESRVAFANFEPYLRRLMTTSPGVTEGLLAAVTRMPEVVLCLVLECLEMEEDETPGKADGSPPLGVLLEGTPDFLPSLRLSVKEGLEVCGSPAAAAAAAAPPGRCGFGLWAALRALLSPEGGVLWPTVVDFVRRVPRGPSPGPSPLSCLGVRSRDGDGPRIAVLCKRFALARRPAACVVVRCAAVERQNFTLRFPVSVTSPCPKVGPHADVEAQMDRLIDGLAAAFPAGPRIPLQEAMGSLGIEGSVNAATGLFELKAAVPCFPSTTKRDTVLRRCFTETPAPGGPGRAVAAAEVLPGGSLDTALSPRPLDGAGRGTVREVIPPRPPQRRNLPHSRTSASPKTSKLADPLSSLPVPHLLLERHPSGDSVGTDAREDNTLPPATPSDIPAILLDTSQNTSRAPSSILELEPPVARPASVGPPECPRPEAPACSPATSEAQLSPRLTPPPGSEEKEAVVEIRSFGTATDTSDSLFRDISPFVTFSKGEIEEILRLAAACRARSPRNQKAGSPSPSPHASPRGAMCHSQLMDVLSDESGAASPMAVLAPAMAPPAPPAILPLPLAQTQSRSSPLFPTLNSPLSPPTSPGGLAPGNPLVPQRPPAGRPSANSHARATGRWATPDYA